MASYWTKKDDESEELRTIKPWEEAVGHGNVVFPKKRKEFLELSQNRYSVRAYSDEPVAEEDIQYIMECARLAPSAVNKQPWKFYLCKSEEALDKVRQCYARDWFKEAPLVIVCCIKHDEEWVRSNDGHPHGIVDISIATEHVCLAAAERDLGTCWVCNFDAKLCHERLALPENEEAAVLIPIGHPATAEIPEKKRKAMEEIIVRL